MNQVEATVISNTVFFPESVHSEGKRVKATYLMWLDCPTVAQQARPGQFVMAQCGELVLPRPLSIHQVKADSLALLFNVLDAGKGTPWLAERHRDEKLQLFGPLGNGFDVSPARGRLLLVAGGMGIAPLYFLAQHAASRGAKVTLLMGSETGSLLYRRQLFPQSVDVFTTTDDGSAGKLGMVTSLIPEHAGLADGVFACGPLPMYRAMADAKKELGLDGKPVKVSLEMVMACGHGACYGCTVRTQSGLKQVCKDGPVFDLDDIVWKEMISP